MWDTTSNLCRQSCYYKEQEACGSDRMCEYNPALEKSCRRECSTFIKSACLQDDYCDWNGKQCYKVCTQRRGYTACAAAGDVCDWKGPIATIDAQTASDCYRACSLYAGQAECLADPNSRCKWDSKANSCEQKCELNGAGAASCTSDSQCLFNYADAVCELKCVYKHTTSFNCNLESRCMWNPIEAQCAKGCEQYNTTSTCMAISLCEPKGTSGCEKKCPYRYLTSKGCKADSECIWDNSTSRCNKLCTLSYTEPDCRSNVRCEWDNTFKGFCPTAANRTRCAPLGTSESLCTGYGCCYNAPGTAACPNEADCALPYCFIPETRCAVACRYKYDNATACDSDAGCNWNASHSICQKDCSKQGTTESECTSTDLCEWVNSKCENKCASKYYTDAECSTNPKCMWSNVSSSCILPCSQMAKQQCWANTGICIWENDKCQMTCQQKHRNPTDCNADSMCMWNGKSGKCDKECSRVTSATQCGALDRCQWQSWTSLCRPLCSEWQAAGSVACKKDAGCEWENALNASNLPSTPAVMQCQRPCKYRYTQQASCSNDKECVWDTKSETCMTTCVSIVQSGFASAPFFEKACLVSATCEISNKMCVMKCGTRHTSMAPCNADLEG
jgi:hypothetical protein